MHIFYRRAGSARMAAEAIVSQMDSDIRIVRNDRKAPLVVDTAIRWGCTSPLDAKVVINEAHAIGIASNKTGFRKLLVAKKLCPDTWFTEGTVKFPAIVRPSRHEQGNDFHVVKDKAALAYAVKACGPDFYASKIIKKAHEYRVFVMQGRVSWVVEKVGQHADDHLAWNLAEDAAFQNLRFSDWPLRVVKASITATLLAGLDFGAVDVIVDKADKPFVLEINTCAGLISEYRSGCIAKCFDWMIAKGKATIPLIDEKGGYLKFIHPAITPKALLT